MLRVRDLGDVEDEETMDVIFAGLDELLERFTPDLNRRATWRELEEERIGERADRASEMDAILEGIEARARFRPLARQLDG